MTRLAKRLLPALAIAFILPGALLAAPAAPKKRAAKPTAAKPAADPLDQSQLRGLEWRCVGPYRGGRVTAVTGVPGQPGIYFFGGTGSGIWKTTNSGVSWQPVADGQLATGSVGAVAVAPSDPSVMFAGMGEACIRGNVSHGDGVYKSTDAGRTWRNVGLRDSRQVGRIRVHPRDPDLVYVAALGHTFGPSHERGVYRSKDGGASWQRVLFVNDSTGAVDLDLDPRNPRVLYAATWQAYRTPWSLESGGAGSGLFRSSDGGDSWIRLGPAPAKDDAGAPRPLGEGLPKGPWGRVGVAVSPPNPERIWAMIEADEGGLYRSDDGGKNWRRVNEDRNLRQRAWYYTHVHADPRNPEGVFVLNVQFQRSLDGGRTFSAVRLPHGDHHDLWVDPDDPRRMVNGNDGGASVSLDGGTSWSGLNTQPTAQFYHVITDDRFPYHLYGAQQDNSTVAIASRTRGSGIGPDDWYDAGGCESGFIAPKPGDPEITYAGCYDGYIGRLDQRTGQERDVTVYPENPMGWGAEGMKYRFQWTFPIVISPHDPNTVYACANLVFRSTNEGQSWQAISPDLTRNDPRKLGPSGGPITKDNTSVEYYCTIFAFAESRLQKGLLWAGSDDGRVHVSRDGGGRWSDVTPRALGEWTMVSQIDPSPHDPGTAWLAVNRYKLDDYRPYAYVTRDFGKSWQSVAGDLPEGSFVRAVREDPVRRNLLYAATETGVFFSVDGGARWRPLRMNLPGRILPAAKPEDDESRGALPVVPITDLVVKDDDIVVSTQGRSFWIMDDVGPLRELAARATADARLFAPGDAALFGGPPGPPGQGQNPPFGALVYYRLERAPGEKEEVTLEFLDESGKSIRKLSSKGDPGAARAEVPAPGQPPPAPRIPAKPGLNRFAWDLRYADASRFPGLILWGGGLQGPRVVPGRYQARLAAVGDTLTQSFEVRKDPRLATSAEDYRARFDLQLGIRDKLTAAHDAITRIRDLRDQLNAVAERSKTAGQDTSVAAAARALTQQLTEVEEALYQTKNKSSQDPLNYPIRLNNKLSDLAGVVESADARPTDQAVTVYQDLAARVDAELARLDKLVTQDLDSFNRLVREKEIPAVVVKAKDKDKKEKAEGGLP